MEDSIISSYSAVLVALLIQNDSVCVINVIPFIVECVCVCVLGVCCQCEEQVA